MSAGDSTVRPKFSTIVDAYDVRIRIDSDDESIFEQIKAICTEAFVGRLRFNDGFFAGDSDLHYRFTTQENGAVLYDLDGVRSAIFKGDIGSSRHLNSLIRAHVAGKTKRWVFVHAGVVEWRGRAIIIPGQSSQGKTTLVSELIRIGAGYMSDEFAILDENGLVHPFDRDLAVRIPEAGFTKVTPATFGATKRLEPIQAGMVLITRFVEDGEWNPTEITVGNGILESIPQVIPVSFNTEFALKVLNTTFNRAIIVKSDRGEARDTAPKILAYFDESLMAGAETLA